MRERIARLRYVALGDSYTIGTAVAEPERWPNLLVERLAARAADAGTQPPLELAGNLGVNGYTSRDVVEQELPALADKRPGFASILVGVNDVVQGVPETVYRANATTILDTLLERLPANRIVAVETPDYTVTPQGAAYGDPARQSAGIARVNAILAELAGARAIRFVGGIFALSRAAATDPSLVAEDGLHPSGRQYGRWVELIAPVVAELLEPRD